MNLMNIFLNTAQICGNTDGTAMAIGVAPGYQYQDGKKTDTITYTKVNTVFVDNAYEKMSVKVLDTKPILTQEAIELAGGKKKIKFKNLTGKIYRTANGDYAVSVSADSMEVLP